MSRRFLSPVLFGLLLSTPASAQAPQDTDVHELITEQRAEIARLRADLDQQRAEVADVQRKLAGGDGERVSYGQMVRVAASEDVKDVVAFGNDVRVIGRVQGDATSFGGNVEVSDGGVVEGDAIAFGGQVIVHPGGDVRGDRVSLGLGGTPIPDPSAASVLPSMPWSSLWSGLYHRLVLLLSFAGAGVLVIGLAPNRVARIANGLKARPIRSLFVGMIAAVLLSLSALLFGITILGLPVSFLLITLLGLAWLMGMVGLCQAVGDHLPLRQNHGRWVAFLVATLLLSFMGSMPWVGWLVVMSASVLGIGGALSTRLGAI